MASARPSAVVTGASSGIGEAFADRLARDGHDVVVVARRRERLEALAARLREATGAKVDVLAADLATRAGLRAIEELVSSDDKLAMLVNNAGFAAYMPFVKLDPDKAEEQIQLHLVAMVRLAHAALPGMVARGAGAIVNVSSLLGFSAASPLPHLPKRATYAASKAYINAFSQILAREVEGTGVRVQALCPGVVRTEFHEVAKLDLSHLPPAAFMPPADVVQASMAGLKLGEVICAPSLEDATVITAIDAASARVFEGVRSGSGLASRYR
jgi:short-subunit dehydrogenase